MSLGISKQVSGDEAQKCSMQYGLDPTCALVVQELRKIHKQSRDTYI